MTNTYFLFFFNIRKEGKKKEKKERKWKEEREEGSKTEESQAIRKNPYSDI